jgi:hypothetical protein
MIIEDIDDDSDEDYIINNYDSDDSNDSIIGRAKYD